MRPSSLAVGFERLGPYHLARLSALAQDADAPRVHAVEVYRTDATYAWSDQPTPLGIERHTLLPKEEGSDPARVWQAMQRCLEDLKPALVAIPGWSHPAALAALAWARRARVPAVLMSDSTAWDEPRRFVKEQIKRLVVSRFQAALVAGTPHAAYLESLGLSPERIATGYDVVDNAHFELGAEAARAEAPTERQRLGVPERYLLACARFVAKKNLLRLVEAYARYRALRGEAAASLVIVGDGPQREALAHHIGSLGLNEHVCLPGFIQYDELPRYYGLATAFVHPSVTEQWGLVVNEAMAAGLPVLVSNRCGCAQDLVIEGVTGYRFEPDATEDLAVLMQRMTGNPEAIAVMGEAARRHIRLWGLEAFAAGMQRAMGFAAQASHRTPFPGERHLLWSLARR
jgi:glycosyltransferase involved in cell wall biosynthesis